MFEYGKGRFDQILYVPQPNIEERWKLLQYFAKRYQLNCNDWELSMLSMKLKEGMSGAEIENICREVKMKEIYRQINALH